MRYSIYRCPYSFPIFDNHTDPPSYTRCRETHYYWLEYGYFGWQVFGGDDGPCPEGRFYSISRTTEYLVDDRWP